MKTPFECFQCYLALKMHFTQEKYDYIKYNGKVKADIASFEKRKDKYMFYSLSKKKDPEKYILANMLENPKMWVGDLLSKEAEKNYLNYVKVEESLTYCYQQDLKKLDENFNSNFVVKNGQRPLLLKLFNMGEVSIHTMVILDKLVNYIPYWDKKLGDNIIWPDSRMKIEKFKPFLTFDEKNLKKVTKSLF